MSFEAELGAILQTTEKNALKRATGLRILPTCDRCGGSGHYSYNQISGTVCFGCAGSGQVKPTVKQRQSVLEEARAVVADGRLAKYLDDIAAMARSKNATDKVMAAWRATGISSAYDWRRAVPSSPNATDRDVSIAAINAKMAAAYDMVQTAMGATYVKDPVKRMNAFVVLDQKLTEALEVIARAAEEFQEFLKKDTQERK